MKKITCALMLFVLTSANFNAQEKYGKTLNLGLGLGYYGVSLAPAFHANYEIDLFRNFTLAPFISYQTHKSHYYGYDRRDGLRRDRSYRQSYMPIGVKGSYYFDELFNAGEKWDFYAAGSLGFAIIKTTWDDGYEADTDFRTPAALYGSLHIGAEVHLSEAIGLFLDMSTGMSTFGLAIHF